MATYEGKRHNDSLNMDSKTPLQTTAWYRTRGGLIFLTIIGSIILIGFGFLVLVGFYTWKIKYQGGAATLQKQFQTEQFTLSNQRSNPSSAESKDPAQYIRSFDPIKGNKTAPIKIVAFIDFECPFCRQGYPLFRTIMNKYDPVVEIVFKQFPLDAIHPKSVMAANAAACAGANGKFWPYYDSLFSSEHLDRSDLIGQAQTLGVPPKSFTDCLDARTHQSDIDQDIQDGLALGVRGTPTYFVNTTKIEGVTDEATWDTILLEQIKNKTNK